MSNAYQVLGLSPIDLWRLVLALIGGALLGVFYFGGLWWTIRRLEDSAQPTPLFLISFWLRTVLTMGGFLLVSGNHWLLWLSALATFFAARAVLVRRWGPSGAHGPVGGSDAVEPG